MTGHIWVKKPVDNKVDYFCLTKKDLQNWSIENYLKELVNSQTVGDECIVLEIVPHPPVEFINKKIEQLGLTLKTMRDEISNWNKVKNHFSIIYLSPGQIVEDLVKSFTQADISYLESITDKDRLIELPSSLGRVIRNKYNLWDEANPFTDIENENSNNHPDQMSMSIIENAWLKLKKEARKKSNKLSDGLYSWNDDFFLE
jgi:hypothetical protein